MSQPTLDPSGFCALAPVGYKSKGTGKRALIPPEAIVEVIVATNTYLYSLAAFFEEAEFEFYDSIGQRNLSGFIGEVFANAFVKSVDGYAVNPHADGRPDLLDVAARKARDHLETECFRPGDRRPIPVKGKLAPFKYGGLEVKTSVGNPVSGYKKRLTEEAGASSFSVGMPRIDYLQGITYWGHHASCENLVGLYYDYVPELDDSPQVFMAMQAELDVAVDWQKVSVGRSGSKKTSNTSLTKSGRDKLYGNVVATTTEMRYLERFEQIGVDVSGALSPN